MYSRHQRVGRTRVTVDSIRSPGSEAARRFLVRHCWQWVGRHPTTQLETSTRKLREQKTALQKIVRAAPQQQQQAKARHGHLPMTPTDQGARNNRGVVIALLTTYCVAKYQEPAQPSPPEPYQASSAERLQETKTSTKCSRSATLTVQEKYRGQQEQ